MSNHPLKALMLEASTAPWSSWFHLLITLFEKKYLQQSRVHRNLTSFLVYRTDCELKTETGLFLAYTGCTDYRYWYLMTRTVCWSVTLWTGCPQGEGLGKSGHVEKGVKMSEFCVRLLWMAPYWWCMLCADGVKLADKYVIIVLMIYWVHSEWQWYIIEVTGHCCSDN